MGKTFRIFAVGCLLVGVLVVGCSSEQYCPRCNGEGRVQSNVPNPRIGGRDMGYRKRVCPVCYGKGKVKKL